MEDYETIFYPNGDCDLDKLDEREQENELRKLYEEEDSESIL